LRQNHLEQISILHQKASHWYQRHGLWSDAIQHAFASQELERVADLAELAWRPMNERYQAVAWLGWVKALPEDLVCSRPALCAGCGWASLDAGDLEAAELHFQNAERCLESTTSSDEDAFRSLTASIANGRAYLAQALGDINGTLKYARRATDLLRENDYFERGLSEILPGFAYWASGDLEAAHDAVAEAIANMRVTGKLLFVISFTSYLANIMTAQGRLHEAVRTYLGLLDLAAEWGKPQASETAVPHLGLSELYLEQGDIDAALRHLRRSEEFGELPWFAPWYRHWVYAHVRVMQAQGDLDGVVAMLNGAERLYYRHPIPDVRPLAALMARARLAQGNSTDALSWAHRRGLSVDDDLSYLQEFEHITLARVLIAQFRKDQEEDSVRASMGLLKRLLEAAEGGGGWEVSSKF
jgi:LuxR family maltose regulon positive regulatory protein